MLINIRKPLTILAAAALPALFGVMPANAQSDLNFKTSSRLNEGKWVKVSVSNQGVCRISYDELRNMGFSNPEKVAVFGRGGNMLEVDFTDSEGNQLYSDDLPAVSTMHRDNALYFYCQGVHKLEYTDKGVDRKSNNVYSNKSYYFLSDSQTDASMMTTASATPTVSADQNYATASGYMLIEEDNIHPHSSGEEFFSWDLAAMPSRKVKVSYNLPGSAAGADVKMAFFGAAKISGPDSMVFNMISGDETSQIGTVNFLNLTTDAYYGYSGDGSTIFTSGTLPGAKGELEIYNPNSNRSSFSAVDYVVLTALRTLALTDDESSFEVFTPDYTADKGPVAIPSAPSDLVVWDVVNSNDVVILPYTTDESGTAFAAGLRENKTDGTLVVFSAAGDLAGIDGYEELPNQNLHATAKTEIPAMLIITTPELKSEAEHLAALHRQYQNEKVVVAVSSEIINEFSQGTPDPMAYRALVRMIYDADNASDRTFKSVLLFGSLRTDNRGLINRLPDQELLLCKGSRRGDSVTTSFTTLDFYGQMADYYSADFSDYNYFRRNQDVVVAIIPADTPAVAKLYVNKVEKWLTDTSVAWWLPNVVYTADGSNANEHIEECDAAADFWNQTDNSFTPHKLFNHTLPAGDIRPAFIRTINDGVVWANYLGHASMRGLNTLLWDKGNYVSLKNDRLGFMYFGGCTISDFDQGNRGSGEEMLLSTPHGLIGAILSNRSTLSYSNSILLLDLVKASLLDNPFGEGASDKLLASPHTYGEIVRTAFNANTRNNSNKLAYAFLCDPALQSPMPSAAVTITSDDEAITELTPGTSIAVSGTISDRDGKMLDNFNGEVVLKLFAPPFEMDTYASGDSPAIPIIHDNRLIFAAPFDVENGAFSGTLRIPEALADAGSTLTLRMGAFDHSTRRTASGSLSVTALAFDVEKSTIDTESPVVERFYAENPDFVSGDVVGPDPVIYAVITDNVGMKTGGSTIDSNLDISIDGKKADNNIAQFATLSNEGRTLNLRFPSKGLTPGMHTARVTAFDNSGNSCAASIQFNVQPVNPSATSVSASPSVVRDTTAIDIATDPEAGYTLKTSTVIITDALGNIVKTINTDSNRAEWDATDAEGKRVGEGVYYARCRYTTAANAPGITDPIRLVVIRSTK